MTNYEQISYVYIRAQHFLRICTHTQTTPINNDLCPPIAWHVPTHAHSCYSNCAHVFKKINITNSITHNIAPMPTPAHPWTKYHTHAHPKPMGRAGMGMGTQCRALVYIHPRIIKVSNSNNYHLLCFWGYSHWSMHPGACTFFDFTVCFSLDSACPFAHKTSKVNQVWKWHYKVPDSNSDQPS